MVCKGQAIADKEECLYCKYRTIEKVMCTTDRGEQDLSYPICTKEDEGE